MSKNNRISKYNHAKALSYLERIEVERDEKTLEDQYSKVEGYMQTLRDSRSFKEGFDKVMDLYKNDTNNKDSFVLISLLEEFHTRFFPNRFYTEDLHNKDFDYALSIAPEVEQSVLGAISDTLGE